MSSRYLNLSSESLVCHETCQQHFMVIRRLTKLITSSLFFQNLECPCAKSLTFKDRAARTIYIFLLFLEIPTGILKFRSEFSKNLIIRRLTKLITSSSFADALENLECPLFMERVVWIIHFFSSSFVFKRFELGFLNFGRNLWRIQKTKSLNHSILLVLRFFSGTSLKGG